MQAVAVVVVVAALVCPASAAIKSVTFSGAHYHLHDGLAKNWVARGSFTDNTFVDGWGYLEVQSSAVFPDPVQAYAAGLVEGALTHSMIYNAYRNTLEGICDWKSEKFCDALKQYLKHNLEWMQTMVIQKSNHCPVWNNVGLVLTQVNGVADGYNRSSTHPMMDDAVLWMNMAGDLEDLETALDPQVRTMTQQQWVKAGHTTAAHGHCSALIKLLPANADLYVAHDTWNTGCGQRFMHCWTRRASCEAKIKKQILGSVDMT